MMTPASNNPTTIGKCTRRASGGTPTITAIAMANFAKGGSVTACARKYSKVPISSAPLKFTDKFDELTIVLGPPKPTDEYANRREPAYRAAPDGNEQPEKFAGLASAKY